MRGHLRIGFVAQLVGLPAGTGSQVFTTSQAVMVQWPSTSPCRGDIRGFESRWRRGVIGVTWDQRILHLPLKQKRTTAPHLVLDDASRLHGATDSALDYGSSGCRFESCWGHVVKRSMAGAPDTDVWPEMTSTGSVPNRVRHVFVAQWIAHLVPDQGVAGSSPAEDTWEALTWRCSGLITAGPEIARLENPRNVGSTPASALPTASSESTGVTGRKER